MPSYKQESEHPNLKQMEYINHNLDLDAIKRDISRSTDFKEVRLDGIVWIVPILRGVISIDDFLTDEMRCVIEQRVYTHGDDLSQVYDISKTPYGDNEINILHADKQIPHVGSLQKELDFFLSYVHTGLLTRNDIEIRELTAKKEGHSRHQDHKHGYTIGNDSNGRFPVITTSISLPLGSGLDNQGNAPPFIIEEIKVDGSIEHHSQEKPGSLVFFGPTLYHTHPPTMMMKEPYLWLVSQPFFKVGK